MITQDRAREIKEAITNAGIGAPAFIRGGSPEQATWWMADQPISEYEVGEEKVIGFAGGQIAVCSVGAPTTDVLVIGVHGSVLLAGEDPE